MGFSDGSVSRVHLQCRSHRRHGFDTGVGRITWRRALQPPPAFLPRKPYVQRNLASFRPWGCQESGMAEENERAHRSLPGYIYKETLQRQCECLKVFSICVCSKVKLFTVKKLNTFYLEILLCIMFQLLIYEIRISWSVFSISKSAKGDNA